MARPSEVLGAVGGFGLAGAVTALAAIAPIVALAVIALGGDGQLWRHLFATVVPRATVETAILADLIPGAKLLNLPWAGHEAQAGAAEAVAAAVLRFLSDA